MRLRSTLFAALAALCTGFFLAEPASAFGEDKPAGWGHARDVHHWAYYPRYRHVYHVDPYAYQYSPRGYYPYYGSQYWRPAAEVRRRNRLHYHVWNTQPPRFRYQQSWGYPRTWHHHRTTHGRRYHPWHY